MSADRRIILSLVAAGRITARDAERLLAVTEDEWLLRLALAAGLAWACFAGMHSVLARVAANWLPALLAGAHHLLANFAGRMGGVL